MAGRDAEEGVSEVTMETKDEADRMVAVGGGLPRSPPRPYGLLRLRFRGVRFCGLPEYNSLMVSIRADRPALDLSRASSIKS